MAAAEKIIKSLWDPESGVRAAACWTLSKLLNKEEPPHQQTNANLKKCLPRLVELLKDSFWKVRTSSCIALGSIARDPTTALIEGLLRVLNDGSIKK